MTEPTPSREAVAVEAFTALRRTMLLIQDAVGRMYAEQGDITLAQFEILFVLSTHPEGVRMHELADQLLVSRSGLTYQIARLEESGLVVRRGEEGNERAVVAAMTDEGTARFAALRTRHFAFVEELFLGTLDPGEIATLTALFGRIGDRVQQARRA